MGEAGLAEMNMTVHHDGHYMQTVVIDYLAGCSARRRQERGNATGADAGMAHPGAVAVDDGGSREHQIVGLDHFGAIFVLSLCPQRLRFAASSGKR